MKHSGTESGKNMLLLLLLMVLWKCQPFNEDKSDPLEDNSVKTDTLGQRRSLSTKDEYCSRYFFPVINNLLSELDHHFNNLSLSLMRAAQVCSPKSSNEQHELEIVLLATLLLAKSCLVLHDLSNSLQHVASSFSLS